VREPALGAVLVVYRRIDGSVRPDVGNREKDAVGTAKIDQEVVYECDIARRRAGVHDSQSRDAGMAVC
jgi:hypothetical protein